MIETSGVTHLVGFDAAIVCVGDDVDVAVALSLVAHRPPLDFWPPRGCADDVSARGECAFPSALPVFGRRAGAAAQKDKKQVSHLTRVYHP